MINANGAAAPGGTWMPAPNDLAYRQIRDNVTTLLEGRPAVGTLAVPACPRWTVRDVVAHLVEIAWKATERFAGRSASAPFPGAGEDLDLLLERWNQIGPVVDDQLVERPSAR